MIARGLILLVSILVLFINNNQPKIMNRSKECTPRSKNNTDLAISYFLPIGKPFKGRLFRVQNGNPATKSFSQLCNDLSCKRNFRNKVKYLSSLVQGRGSRSQKHLRFPTASDSKKQKRFRPPGNNLFCY